MMKSTVIIWTIFPIGGGDPITQIHTFEDTQSVVEYLRTTDARLYREHGAILQVFHGQTINHKK